MLLSSLFLLSVEFHALVDFRDIIGCLINVKIDSLLVLNSIEARAESGSLDPSPEALPIDEVSEHDDQAEEGKHGV